MTTALPEGCWPTMITPYNEEGKIDYPLLKALIGTYMCVFSTIRDVSAQLLAAMLFAQTGALYPPVCYSV